MLGVLARGVRSKRGGRRRRALVSVPETPARAGLAEDAAAAVPDLVTDTFNGLGAFVVPGPDPYSVAQGESTTEAGGIDVFATPALIEGLTFAQPSQPLASIVASLLNMVAPGVNPASASGP